jgi:hypothetical protein
MDKLTAFKTTLLWVSVLLVAGCSGITPYDPPDYREEPPGNGLFTGADGEFVIYQKAAEADSGDEINKDKGLKNP